MVFNGIAWPPRLLTPGDPQTGSGVWRLNGIQVSQAHEFDAYPFQGNGRWAHNTAIRHANAGTLIATQYVAFGVPAPSRVVAHVGFIDGSPTRLNSGRVLVDVRVTDPGFTFVRRWVGTTTPIVSAKARKTLTLIDIPLTGPAQVGQLPVGNRLAPPGFTSGLAAVPMDYLYLPPPPQADYATLTAGTPSIVAVTIVTNQTRFWRNSTTGKREALGVFGLRLIP
jgi:hypothetical protein